MDESTKSRIGGVQPIPVRSESKRRKWLLLLLTILLLTSIGVITGILLHTSNKYDLSSYTQTTTPAEFKKMTLQELAQTMTSDSLTDQTATGPADFKTTELQTSAQNMTIDLSSNTQTTTSAEFKKMTLQELAQTMTSDSLTDQTTTGPADFKTTELQTSAQNMTIDLSSNTQTTTSAEFKKMTLQELAQTMTSDSLTDQTATGPADFKTTELQTSAQNMTIETMPIDCKELYMNGKRKSGVYTIYPWEKTDPNYRPVQAYCDMETEGGGWTAIQRRINGEESFNRNWTEYKLGFGTPYGDYWIGNDAIHQLSSGRNSSLCITITPMNSGFVSFKIYHQFYVFGEDQNYRLQLANPGNGSLGDSLLAGRHKATGMQFTTFDADNDKYIDNCAADFLGGWWFKMCHIAYLNGPWQSHAWANPWFPEYTSGRQVNGTSMLIKSH